MSSDRLSYRGGSDVEDALAFGKPAERLEAKTLLLVTTAK